MVMGFEQLCEPVRGVYFAYNLENTFFLLCICDTKFVTVSFVSLEFIYNINSKIINIIVYNNTCSINYSFK